MTTVFAILLILTIFIRPQEFIPSLQALSLLNVFTVLAVLSLAFEVFAGWVRSLRTPQLKWLAAFVLWSLFATFMRLRFEAFEKIWKTVGFSMIFMLIVAFAGRSYYRFLALASVLCVVSAFLIGVGISQATAEFQCIEISEEDAADPTISTGEPNGHICKMIHDCYNEDDPTSLTKDFLCEKVGPFDTFSIGRGRIRYRGILADPNELSLAIGASLAFVLGMHGLLRGKLRHLGLLAALGGAGYVVVQTQSRGGILVLMAVLGFYFIKRFGLYGVAFGAITGAPLLLLGGREGEEARASTMERTEALYEGFNMVRDYPVLGVGLGQFVDHHIVTAHNSYLLAAAELGLPGLVFWSLLLYVSVKIPLLVAYSNDPGLARIKPLGFSLLASFAGIAIGIAFLSFSYHNMLFIYLGLAGALYGVAKESSPTFKVGVSFREGVVLAMFDMVFLVFLYVYTRLKI